jgi:hypothetical protein
MAVVRWGRLGRHSVFQGWLHWEQQVEAHLLGAMKDGGERWRWFWQGEKRQRREKRRRRRGEGGGENKKGR